MNKKIEKVYQDIKSIKIQGATNVALAVVAALKEYASEGKWKDNKQFIADIVNAGKYLAGARVTEPMASNVVEYINYNLKRNQDLPLAELKAILAEQIECFFDIIAGNEILINQHGEAIIKNNDRIFTHCHASTVINLLKSAKKNKKKFQVFQTETRPLLQGHKTAKDLVAASISDTLVVDSAAAFLISAESGDSVDIDKVIIGCDSIARDGSCVNKIGSFGIALTAYRNKIPVYIVTQALKINEDARNLAAIRIELRSASEVWPHAPKGLKIYNPAFDRIPAKYITGYICEFGIVKPRDLAKLTKKNYPWIW